MQARAKKFVTVKQVKKVRGPKPVGKEWGCCIWINEKPSGKTHMKKKIK